jgi:hypothetical protein
MTQHAPADDAGRLRRAMLGLPPTAQSETCPDANVLAGLTAGALLAEERAAVERHLAGCSACRAMVARMAEERAASGATKPVPATARGLGWWWLAAAAVLVSVLVWLRSDARPARQAQLVAAADRLRAESPDLLAELVPLSDSERRRGPEGPLRAGPLRALAPSGVVVERRPALRWEAGDAQRAVVVSLRAADRTLVFQQRIEGTRAEYPAHAPDLAAGDYEWDVADAASVSSATRTFTVVDDAESARIRAALRALDARAPPALVPLLRAHLCLRLRMWSEAEAAAREDVARHGDDPVGRETLYQALVRLGSVEADRIHLERRSR